MGLGLTLLARRYIDDEARFRREFSHPVLLWKAPPEAPRDPLVLGTNILGLHSKRPRSNDPVVFPVAKAPKRGNSFAMGISIGRTENNDLAIDDTSVSRFHAYFTGSNATQWTLVDAGSRNGTWVGSHRLAAKTDHLLRDKCNIRFGDVRVVFYLPEGFFDFLKEQLDG